MKKYILILIILLLSSCSYQTPKQKTTASQANNNLQAPNLQLIAETNKQTYSSYQKIDLGIRIFSDQDLQNVLIEAKGIVNRLNKNYFNQNQLISVQKGSANEIYFSQTLPSCNSCSGLTSGNYSITITANYQGEILASQKINLNIKQ